MRAFGFLERRDLPYPEPMLGDPPPGPEARLTGPIRLDSSNAAIDAYGIAVLAQSRRTSGELARLRFGAVPERDSLAYLTQSTKSGIITKISGHRIGDDDAQLEHGGVELFEYLVILDLDLPAFAGGEDDMAYALGLNAEPRINVIVLPSEARIVAHAEWAFRLKNWTQKYDEEKNEMKTKVYPKGTNVALVNEFEAKLGAMWVKHMAGQEHYGKQLVHNHPTVHVYSTILLSRRGSSALLTYTSLTKYVHSSNARRKRRRQSTRDLDLPTGGS